MKKISRFFFATLAATSVMFACTPAPTPEPEPNPGENTGGNTEEKPNEVTFTATTESLAEWAQGDKISVFDGTSILSAENSEAAGQTAKFKLVVAKDAKAYVAAYPENQTLTAAGASFSVPAEQPAAAPRASMIAKSSNSRLFFRNLTATLSVALDMEGASSFVFTAANGAKIAGDYAVDYTGDDPAITPAESAVASVTVAAAAQVTFTVLPCTIEGYSLIVYDAAGQEIATSVSDAVITLAPGQNAELGTIKSNADLPTVYKVSHVWLYGGTGPEYGGGRVADILNPTEDKAYVFAGPEGHGIEALRDDYIEVAADGSMKFYAGEDGKHWWMAVSKELDSKKYKELTIAHKIEFLPRYEGSVAIDMETGIATLTNAAGEAKEAEVVLPGELTVYEGPADHPEYTRTITFENMALAYTAQNRKDDWDHFASDVDVYYNCVRKIFYELEQMPAGFVVPEAAKTIDETEYVEPDYPADVTYDITTLPGSYTLKEYKVLGGSGSDPAFVGVVDKSWCWDDSVWNISDDQLDIVATGMTAAEATGTVNYWAGANEKFWDYIWHPGKEDEQDMSSVYNRLPKGNKTFTYNITTKEITFEGGVEAKLLTPGDYHFEQGNRDLTIESTQIGIQFDVMEMIDATPQQWTDVDRFVNAPILYVMLFEKNAE